MGGLDIDRFATAQNKVLPKFNSYFMETGCMGIDAFAQTDWMTLRNFCNPPISQLNKLLTFIKRNYPRAPCVIITPKWQQQPWFQGFLDISDSCLLLPDQEDLVENIT